MVNIREGTFETNSSSAHNMVIVEDSQLEKWKNGDLFFIEHGNKFISKWEKETYMKELYGKLILENANNSSCAEEIAEAIREHQLEQYVQDMIDDELWYVDKTEIPLSFKEWTDVWNNRDLEREESSYVTPKGEKLHIFCQFGYEG